MKSLKIDIPCKTCEKNVPTIPSKAKKNKNIFCSYECYWISLGRKPGDKGKVLPCAVCGKRKYFPASRIKLANKNVCSVKCRHKLRQNRESHPCSNCGKVLTRALNTFIGRENYFCNCECRNKYNEKNGLTSGANNGMWKDAKMECVCKICGKAFVRFQSQIKGELENATCSRECRSIYQSIYMCGENSPSWKGGQKKSDYCPNFRSPELRHLVFGIFGNDCVLCGMRKPKNKTHNLHHIDYDVRNCDAWNLVPLCDSCHAKTNGNRLYWIEVLTEFSLEVMEIFSNAR